MATISTSGKLAYMYDEPNDTWYAISGAINTAAAYNWVNTNTFSNTVIFEDIVKAEGGVNNYQTAAARDIALPNPVNGLVCFVRQTNSGQVINQIQYYHNGVWRSIADGYVNVDTKIDNYTIDLLDAGRMILFNSASDRTLFIPTNASQPFSIGQTIDVARYGLGLVTISPLSGVILYSEGGISGPRNLSAQYSSAKLIKVASDTWLMTSATDLRQTYVSTSDPSGGSDGDFWFKYTP